MIVKISHFNIIFLLLLFRYTKYYNKKLLLYIVDEKNINQIISNNDNI